MKNTAGRIRHGFIPIVACSICQEEFTEDKLMYYPDEELSLCPKCVDKADAMAEQAADQAAEDGVDRMREEKAEREEKT